LPVPRVGFLTSHPHAEHEPLPTAYFKGVASGAGSVVRDGVEAGRTTSNGWQIPPARRTWVVKSSGRINRRTELPAVLSYEAERRSGALDDRRFRFRGTSARACYEKSANDRSDSPVSERTSERSIAEEEGRKEGRTSGHARRRRTIGFRVHAYSSAQRTQKWVNPTQRRPFSRASHSVA